MKAAGLPSGTLYPLLARLEDQKLVTSAWETPQQDGQRPRKYYRLTGEGSEVARLELAQVSAGRARRAGPPGPPGPGEPGMRGERRLLRIGEYLVAPGLPATCRRGTGRAVPGMGGRATRHPPRSPGQAGPRAAPPACCATRPEPSGERP